MTLRMQEKPEELTHLILKIKYWKGKKKIEYWKEVPRYAYIILSLFFYSISCK